MSKNEDSTEFLQSLRDELLTAITHLKTQIAHAKSEAAATGVYSDREWFQSASHALRMKGLEHQRVLIELGRRRREAGKQNLTNELQEFKRFARMILPNEVFMRIAECASNRIQLTDEEIAKAAGGTT